LPAKNQGRPRYPLFREVGKAPQVQGAEKLEKEVNDEYFEEGEAKKKRRRSRQKNRPSLELFQKQRKGGKIERPKKGLEKKKKRSESGRTEVDREL